ncbi:hypothetical protein T265_06875 [Opisthorchis viverrini]|uniref:Uncharacterized protein n=1 Tax=Opisthorchis viverrini TaxID=6198 RepID=A0A074ZIW9_OPIVI|nr:hypothetical protein T265_06875 [Opisthorchis viverrini]KER25702.1 hypothetical protein T265_06875 [Opisthorchis viverrini]
MTSTAKVTSPNGRFSRILSRPRRPWMTREYTQTLKKSDCGQTSHTNVAKSENCWLASSTLSVPNCHATRRRREGWDTHTLPKPGQSRGRGRIRTTDISVSKFALQPLGPSRPNVTNDRYNKEDLGRSRGLQDPCIHRNLSNDLGSRSTFESRRNHSCLKSVSCPGAITRFVPDQCVGVMTPTSFPFPFIGNARKDPPDVWHTRPETAGRKSTEGR